MASSATPLRPDGLSPVPRRLLVVEAHGTYYGVDADRVREIVPQGRATRIPGAPPWVRGLLNLRGSLLTSIELAQRMQPGTGQVRQVGGEPSSVIVQDPDGRLLAIGVDEVHDVHLVDAEAIGPPPGAGTTSPTGLPALVAGLGHFDGKIVLLIDVGELVRQVLA